MATLLFVYGTLAPSAPEAAAVAGWSFDRVRGRLFDLGPYPALIDVDSKDDWVEGYVRKVGLNDLQGRLDDYEGVADGLYRRVRTTTEGGREVWVYVYARDLPPDARGPIPRWNGPRAGVLDPV